jgi:murein DD-endopeptidase MepM/ murein hydrolase activator NlpD
MQVFETYSFPAGTVPKSSPGTLIPDRASGMPARREPAPLRYRLASISLLATLMLGGLQVAASESMLVNSKKLGTSTWAIHVQPAKLVNGSPIVFQVAAPTRMTRLSARWLEHEVLFSNDATSKIWYGIAGVSLETRPGTYPLELKGITSRGAEISFVRKFAVRPAKYPSVAVTVAKRYTEPSQQELERIHQDKTVKQDVFRQTDPQREWLGKFHAPVDARISDDFGTRRTFNGKVQSMHQGLDYAVPPGTPVSAANTGTVLLASPLYFEGNCVVLDHGQGLLTLYLHLSDIKVKPGERVKSGQEIGLSGGSGRATGPHLHLAVRWQGVYLNPATLLTLKLP